MMKQGNKLRAILSALIASALVLQTALPAFAMNAGGDNEIPKAHLAKLVFDDPSEYGESNAYLVDEDGNILPEFNLIPEGQDRLDTALPSSYDLRDYNRVTSAKSQGRTGTCWAHSAMGAAESSLITDGLANTSIDLSEAHLVWFSQGQNTDPSDPLYNDVTPIGTTAYIPGGGNVFISRGALASWIGADYESNYANVTAQPQISEAYRYNSAFHLQKSVMLDASDTNSIKSYLMENGALTLSYYYDENYESVTNSYTSYYQNVKTGTNHAVTLIGWDDNFSKSNFTTTAPGDGAWIIKNSWGTGYGDNGCFYLSYYDTSISYIASLELENKTNYASVYQYDMFSSGTLYYDYYGITGANVFTASGSDPLAAVSFYTAEASNKYTIRIYSGVTGNNPANGTLLHTQTGTATYAGYHTVPLSKTVSIPSGTKFSVLVTFENIGANLWFDTNSNGAGQSYFTYGTGTASSPWNDAYTEVNLNVCIKAFTKNKSIAKPVVTATPGDGQVTLTWNAVPSATTYYIYSYLGDGQYALLGATSDLSYTAAGLTNGQTYQFLVRAFSATEGSPYELTDLVSATPQAKGLAKPVLDITVGDGAVYLSWSAVPNATYYYVYFYNSGTNGFDLYGVTTGNGCYVGGLVNGQTYGYLVRAFNDYEGSPYSYDDIVFVTLPAKVTKPVVTATPGDGQVTLSWNAVPNAITYYIYSYLGDGQYALLGVTSDLSYTAAGLTNGQTYQFLVRAFSATEGSPYELTDLVSATPQAKSLAKPTVDITLGDSAVYVSWSVVPNATLYYVYFYNPTINGFDLYGVTTGNGCYVGGLVNGQTYGFLVRAFNDYEGSPYSYDDIVYAVPPNGIAKPNVVAATGSGQVVLSWSAVPNAVAYYVYSYLGNGQFALIGVTSDLSFTATGLTGGQEYRFLVRAFTATDGSVYDLNDLVSATPA